MRSALLFFLGLAPLAVTAPAAAPYQATYRVVSATHSSSSLKKDPPFYNGSSSATWSLARPTSKAPNRFDVTMNGPLVYGLGTVNVRGVFTAQARTNRQGGKCGLTASTGSKTYPAVAPGPLQLALGADRKSSSRVLVAQLSTHATLGNPYFPSECSTSISGEPDSDVLGTKSMPKSAFRQKTVVLRFAGATNNGGIAYRWSTTIKLVRTKLQS